MAFSLTLNVFYFVDHVDAACVVSVNYPSPEDFQDATVFCSVPRCPTIDGRNLAAKPSNFCKISCNTPCPPDPSVMAAICSVGYVSCATPPSAPVVDVWFSFFEKLGSFLKKYL